MKTDTRHHKCKITLASSNYIFQLHLPCCLLVIGSTFTCSKPVHSYLCLRKAFEVGRSSSPVSGHYSVVKQSVGCMLACSSSTELHITALSLVVCPFPWHWHIYIATFKVSFYFTILWKFKIAVLNKECPRTISCLWKRMKHLGVVSLSPEGSSSRTEVLVQPLVTVTLFKDGLFFFFFLALGRKTFQSRTVFNKLNKYILLCTDSVINHCNKPYTILWWISDGSHFGRRISEASLGEKGIN